MRGMKRILAVALLVVAGCGSAETETELEDCDACDKRGSLDEHEPNDSVMIAAEMVPFAQPVPVTALLADGDVDWYRSGYEASTEGLVGHTASLVALKAHPDIRACLFYDEIAESELVPEKRVTCLEGDLTSDPQTGLLGCCATQWRQTPQSESRLLAAGVYTGDQQVGSLLSRVDRLGEALDSPGYRLHVEQLER